jgi:hypothetical protein
MKEQSLKIVVCTKTTELRNSGTRFYSFNLKKKLESSTYGASFVHC